MIMRALVLQQTAGREPAQPASSGPACHSQLGALTASVRKQKMRPVTEKQGEGCWEA